MKQNALNYYEDLAQDYARQIEHTKDFPIDLPSNELAGYLRMAGDWGEFLKHRPLAEQRFEEIHKRVDDFLDNAQEKLGPIVATFDVPYLPRNIDVVYDKVDDIINHIDDDEIMHYNDIREWGEHLLFSCYESYGTLDEGFVVVDDVPVDGKVRLVYREYTSPVLQDPDWQDIIKIADRAIESGTYFLEGLRVEEEEDITTCRILFGS